ncbi:DUF3311 domain-containing protein [Streptomyces oceani]|uniref:DUF3311 domain-containing protein n=1 Tax=Streptomyces oceani TaxID=1075402 RepID=A0A1E7KPM4_9ACTN|nr:DUF3311 domain-containing protein [Streptomyces oceani]OEV05895.1 hypothetical protein AN216_01050 [Streptomyces oceani]
MSPPSSSGGGPTVTPNRVLIALCLVVPFVAMLWVGSYDSVEPTLIGVPFFYWYQMLWVPLSTALTAVAYVLLRREKAARKRQEEGEVQ